MASVADVVEMTTSAVTAGSGALYAHVETPPERYRRLSDQQANAAMQFGLWGDEITCAMYAESADRFAGFAAALDALALVRSVLENVDTAFSVRADNSEGRDG